MVRSFTVTVYGDSILASPRRHSTPSEVNRSTESWGSMVAIISSMRAIIFAKFTSASAFSKPNSFARLIYDIMRPLRIKDLLGIQPVFKQSPPILFFSMRITLALALATINAATRPAEPAPITTTLASKRMGFA